jgi:secreted trypsin-like serine protease
MTRPMNKLLILTTLILSFALGACSPAVDTDAALPPESFGIIGGSEISSDEKASKYSALLYDNKSGTFCTGFLIKENVIMTAAHCIPQNLTDLVIAFGTKPRTGNYTLRRAQSTFTHPEYQYDQKAQNDLALVRLSQNAPQGSRLLSIPGDDFPLKKDLAFTALGYGQTVGSDPQSATGELHRAELKILDFGRDQSVFIVNQKEGKGICKGDSGGPAIMRFQGLDYAVGVASAISWRSAKNEIGTESIPTVDANLCADRSIYMNVSKFKSWIDETLKQIAN